jgi:gliding motility-associated-like protein
LPLNVGGNTITTIVTAQDGVTTDTYTITVTRLPSTNATLTLLQISGQTISPTFATATTSYTSTVSNATTSIKVEAFTSSPAATISINGNAVASGVASPALPLNVGSNTITTIVTAQDGVTTDTYTITVTRLPSTNAFLTLLQISGQTISPTFATGTTSYTSTVSNATTSIKVEAFTSSSVSTVSINGNAVAPGVASPALPLNVGSNTITTIVTAQDGVTTDTYTITVTRLPSSNATLALLQISGQTISPTFATGTTSYTSNVTNATASIKVEAFTNSSVATISINGDAVASGVASPALPLDIGSNTITTVVTAQDGVTTDTYTIIVTRAMPSMNTIYQPIGVAKSTDSISIENDGIVVHQGVSPNGDGINDFLMIEGITAYPDNHLMIIDRSGALVYQTKGYDNSTKTFDGHSNINGRMQLPGTYFYSLDYSTSGVVKHKTGYIILRY